MPPSERLVQYQAQKTQLEQALAECQQRQSDLTQQYLKVLGAIEALEQVVIATPVVVDGVAIAPGN